MEPPILVTGSHRSGTTWVGKMVGLAPGLAYVHEPFNPQRAPGWMGSTLPHWYLYVCAENEGPYLPMVERVLGLRYPILEDVRRVRGPRALGQSGLEWARSVGARARGRRRPLLKDPIALFSSEWLAKRFDARVVVMIRHPAAFAGSLKRLGWGFDFRNWADQPLLLRDLLAPYAREIRDFAGRERDIVDQAVLLWNAVHHAILGYRERHPEWTFLVHEELAEDPVAGFHGLYGRLGLPWSDRVAGRIARTSSPRNRTEVPRMLHRTIKRDSRAASRTWLHRLTDDERARVREGTSELAARFYPEDAWAPGEGAS